jgi:hypothetical protein
MTGDEEVALIEWNKAIEVMLEAYPPKDRAWANHELLRAVNNTDGVRWNKAMRHLLNLQYLLYLLDLTSNSLYDLQIDKVRFVDAFYKRNEL